MRGTKRPGLGSKCNDSISQRKWLVIVSTPKRKKKVLQEIEARFNRPVEGQDKASNYMSVFNAVKTCTSHVSYVILRLILYM